MTENEAEGKFYASGGISDQIAEQITDHIASNRSVYSHNEDQTEYRDWVLYSVYEVEGKNAYTNNLDEVAVEGRLIIKTEHQEFFGGLGASYRRDYESEILENPTWLDICLCANDMINRTGDNHHVFLEGLNRAGSFTLDDKSFILLYDFSMGS